MHIQEPIVSLKYIIQTVLHEQKRATGYDIVKAFDDKWQYIWKASHQQVYRELATLLTNGLVSCRAVRQSDKPDKKVYRLTRKGVDDLRAWQQTPLPLSRANDELLVRIAGWTLTGPKALYRTMEQQVELHRQRLNYYLSVEKGCLKEGKLSTENRMLLLPLRKGILVEQAWMVWAEEVVNTLDAASRKS
jgi:PadR family transcriptional regulator, regulatory protein AphA